MELNIFTSTIKDGIMSKDKKFYKKLTKPEIEEIYNLNRQRFLSKFNLDLDKSVTYNEKNIDKTAKTATYNNKKIKSRVIILKETTPDLSILVETDDSPIIVASAKDKNNKTTAVISLGTIENLDTGIIHDMTEVLMKETDAATFEMTFYIGPCPSKDTYCIDKSILKNTKFWEKSIEERSHKTYVDLRYAIFNELYLEIVDPNTIYFDNSDTVTNDKYFSCIGQKPGKYISCVVFKNEKV